MDDVRVKEGWRLQGWSGRRPEARFRQRGREALRIEALCDAVFAFAVSLLAVSLEVPQNYHEFSLIMQGALPFFATVSLLFLFWYQQYVFFRHYAMNDPLTILLNMAYLAIILFYLYPLKFLFSLLLGSWFRIDLFPKATEAGEMVIRAGEFPQLIMWFSLAYMLIWLLLFVMHHRAWKQSYLLQLTPYEQAYTLKERRGALLNAAVGLAALLLASLGRDALSGMCYLMIPLLMAWNEWMFRKKVSALLASGSAS